MIADDSRTKARFAFRLLAFSALLTLAGSSSAVVPEWPGMYDPAVVNHLNLSTMAAGDITCAGPEDPTTWAEIQQDTTTLVEHPALFWADGEEASKLCVTLRHKGQSAPLGDPLDPKVSLKIDVNQLVPGQRWHGVRKLSLEDGADVDTATEGLAWNLQRIVAEHASTTPDFTPGLANWVTVAVNGTEYGIYTNLEQKDKSFFQHRGIYDGAHTWLYKVKDIQFSPLGIDSPTQTALCYPPFGISCATPDDATLETQLESLIDMDVMLTQGALEMFIVAPDNFFSKNVNYWHGDWDAPVTLKRRYLTDDLDTTFQDSSADIYGADQQIGPSDVQTIILGHPTWGPEFERILCELLAGPLEATSVNAFISSVEATITPALIADPNNNIGTAIDIANRFDALRQYIVDRHASINSQISCSATCAADIDCDDGNSCTDDVCDLDTGFCEPPAPVTGSCDDGAYCTSGDTCVDGVCTGTDTCAAGFSCEPSANACVSEPAFEEFSEAQAASTTTSLTIDTPAGTVEDDLLIAAVTLDGDRSTTLAPPGGQGWTEVALDPNGMDVTFGVWWKLAGASEPASHTFTWSGNEKAYGYITRVTGHDLVTPIAASAVGEGTDASPAAPAVTAGTAGSLILRLGGFDDDDITIGDAGMAGTTTITMNKSDAGAGSASSGATFETRGPSASVPAANFTLTASEEWRTVTLAIVGEVVPAVCGNGVAEGSEQCDDGNTVSGDCCSDICEYELLGSSCDDADVCNGAETCDGAGLCTAGTPLACDDGAFCNGAESCDALLGCQAGTPPPVDDGVACTDDSCDEIGDVVVNTPDDLLCDDADPCTADSCDQLTGCGNEPIAFCGGAVPTTPGWGPPLVFVLLASAGALLVGRRWRALA